MRLTLTIPSKRVSAWYAEADPKRARAWLAALPYADAGESACELHQSLFTLNRQVLDPAQRLELMDLYRAPVAVTTAALVAAFAGSPLPLSPRRRNSAERARQLHAELASGYKCCLHDLAATRRALGRRRATGLAAERALHYLGEVLFDSYRVYLPPPVGIWREIHELYRYAEGVGCAADPVAALIDGAVTVRRSLVQRYLEILLLGAADPYRWPAPDADALRRFLARWAGQARLETDLTAARAVGWFLVDLAADRPPAPLARAIRFGAHPERRALDALGLVRAVQRSLERRDPGRAPAPAPPGPECADLLRRLARAWDHTPRRRSRRHRRRGYVSVCTGLAALHFFSSTAYAPESGVRRPAASPRPSPVSNGPVSELCIEVDGPAVETAGGGDTEHIATRPRVDRWQVRDAAPDGVRLVRHGELDHGIRVGDLVGIQETTDLGRWRAGVVRWIRSLGEDGVEAGVELLAARVQAAVLRTGPRGEAVPGLLSRGETDGPPTLFTSHGCCRIGQDLLVLGERPAAMRLRPGRLLAGTRSFDWFAIAEPPPAWLPTRPDHP